jgi:hypothetical protein
MSSAVATCHVVRLYTSGDEPTVAAVCSTLSPEIVERIRASSKLARRPRRWVRQLDDLRRAHRLPGLAVWFSARQGMPPLPAPIRDPFEPLPLTGKDTEHLQALVDGQHVVPAAWADWLKFSKRRRRRLGWFWILGNFWWVAFQLVPELWHAIQARQMPSATIITLTVILLLVSVLVAVSRQWLIIPRGIITRRRIALPTHGLERFTRSDCTLLIASEGQTWAACVARGDTVRLTNLTEFECVALLAAWQSPAPAPELSLLSAYA